MTIIAQTASAGIPSSTFGPSWLPNGCPAWCNIPELHRDGDHYDDRSHMNLGSHVPLSLARVVDDERPTLDVSMAQHYREVEPRVWVGRDGGRDGTHLTLDEAREMALRVLELVRMAEETGSCFGHCCTCGGDGQVGSNTCPVCHGTGSCGCH